MDNLTENNNSQTNNYKLQLTGYNLKMIAIITMVIDHVGHTFGIDGFRIIGRIAFPLFAFMIAEGVRKTSNFEAYATRLFAFAVISEPFFDIWANIAYIDSFKSALLSINFEYQNVFFTLVIGALMCKFYTILVSRNKYYGVLASIVAIFLGAIFKADYGAVGVLTILLFYTSDTKIGDVFVVVFFAAMMLFVYGYPIQLTLACLIPAIFIYMYNGERGKKLNKVEKYAFYAFYPVHLFILTILYLIVYR